MISERCAHRGFLIHVVMYLLLGLVEFQVIEEERSRLEVALLHNNIYRVRLKCSADEMFAVSELSVCLGE